MFWMARRVNANLARQEGGAGSSGSSTYKSRKFCSRSTNVDSTRYGNLLYFSFHLTSHVLDCNSNTLILKCTWVVATRNPFDRQQTYRLYVCLLQIQ